MNNPDSKLKDFINFDSKLFFDSRLLLDFRFLKTFHIFSIAIMNSKRPPIITTYAVINSGLLLKSNTPARTIKEIIA